MTNDRLLLALDKKQAETLFYALDANLARFRDNRLSFRRALAAEPFHAANLENAIAEFTDELRSIWNLQSDLCVFVGYPPHGSFEIWDAQNEEQESLF